ncbi:MULTISPECIES: MarR family winged helix-turn-helix transcriptional regulator [Methanohalophilus]|nr:MULTISPECIES: MarR family transcriptional regulator [Methanohalophilus]
MKDERVTKKIGFLYWSYRTLFTRKISPHAIGPSQAGFLTRLSEGDLVRQDELVSMSGVDKAIGTRVVRKLMEAGYIRRMRDPTNHRAYLLSLTAEGARMKPIILEVYDSINESLFQGFTDEERDMVRNLLDRMIENLRRIPEP